VKISLDVARGIAHLHAEGDGKFIHGNIKASNVLPSHRMALFSHCILIFICLQTTMERVCALSSDTLDNVVELVFSLLLLLCSKLFGFV
jgi:serine/threonine protein kinase